MKSDFWSHNLGDLLFFLIASLIVVRAVAWDYIKGLLASDWSTTQGRVEMTNVAERHARYFTYYIAHLDYSFRVNNEYYSGYFEKVFLREGSADRFVVAMKDQMVFVRSNPDRPDRSALLKQDQPGGWPA